MGDADVRSFVLSQMTDAIYWAAYDDGMVPDTAQRLARAAYDSLPQGMRDRLEAPPPPEAGDEVDNIPSGDLVAEVLRRAPVCPRDGIPMLGIARGWHYCGLCGHSKDYPATVEAS